MLRTGSDSKLAYDNDDYEHATVPNEDVSRQAHRIHRFIIGGMVGLILKKREVLFCNGLQLKMS